MVYAKGILNRLHEAMVSVYGSERLGEHDGNDGSVIIPGVVCGRKSGNVCIALLDIDLSSSGEHCGTNYLCKYGVISQSGGAVSHNYGVLKSEVREINAAYLPYDYAYTAIIPGDIHIDAFRLPEAIKIILNDFRNYRAELLFEDKPHSGDIKGVTEVSVSAEEIANKMKEFLPDGSNEAIKKLIFYADELHESGIHSKGAFFSEAEAAFLSDGDAYAVYRFESFRGSTAFSRENYRFDESGVLEYGNTLDTIRDKHHVIPGEIITLKQSGEITAWYVDQLAYRKLPDFFAGEEHTAGQNLSLAQMALTEPGIFDEDIDCVDTSTYMSMLTDRINANFIEYIDRLRGMSGDGITNYTSEIARVSEAHYYLTERFNFHFSELDYLLKFKDPLMMVVEAFSADIDKEHSVVMRKLFHERDALKNGRHALISYITNEVGVPTTDDLKRELFERLDKNLADFRDNMVVNSKQYIYDMAEEIATKYAALEYMKTGYDYKTGEIEYLLRFQDPLSVIASGWPSTLDGLADMTDVITDILEDRSSHGHYALVTDEANPAADKKRRAADSTEKQSVIERIRVTDKELKQPRKDKPAQNKTEPEL